MDGAELTPATRRRIDPEPRAPEVAPASGEDAARLAALESAVRAVDVRLEYLERLVSSGFQEIASRSLVVAEATDEALTRIEAAVAALPREIPAAEPVVAGPFSDVDDLKAAIANVDGRVEAIEPRLDEIKRRADDLAVAVVALQPTIDAILDLRSHVELVGGRLSELLGGPSLTELMDRLDEIADRPTH